MISNDGLLRHVPAKGKDKATDLSDSRQGMGISCNSKFKLRKLKDMYVKSEEKLTKDECYPVGVTKLTVAVVNHVLAHLTRATIAMMSYLLMMLAQIVSQRKDINQITSFRLCFWDILQENPLFKIWSF